MNDRAGVAGRGKGMSIGAGAVPVVGVLMPRSRKQPIAAFRAKVLKGRIIDMASDLDFDCEAQMAGDTGARVS